MLGIEAKNIQELSLVNYEISDPRVADVVKIDKKTLAMTFRGLKAGTTQITIRKIDKKTLAMTFRGLKAGTTQITISCGELKQICTVTVQ